MTNSFLPLIPAKAWTQEKVSAGKLFAGSASALRMASLAWVPAFAGMSGLGRVGA
ncbi:MAG: hypothetical protein JSR86_06195 [Proteobacteria bacterium]|nr:hypothetical protein [Pseudomonadota bacterium]